MNDKTVQFLSYYKKDDLLLQKESINLITWKLRMIPANRHEQVLNDYIKKYESELEKISENNYARKGIARHYANQFLKKYR